jgi:hypothetical protein
MTDTNKLAELIKKAKSKMWGKTFYSELERNMFVADYLLANGVIVPTVKVGQTVYVPSGDEGTDWIDEYKVKYFYCSSKGINRYYIECGTMGNNFRPKDIGKTVFLTKEEAEAKLKELGK